jgi:hypothetical protein
MGGLLMRKVSRRVFGIDMNLVNLGVFSQKAAVIALIAGAAAFLLSALAVSLSRIAVLPRLWAMAARLVEREAMVLSPIRVSPGRRFPLSFRHSRHLRPRSSGYCAPRWS